MYIEWEELGHNRLEAKTNEPFFSLRRSKIAGGWLVIFYRYEFSGDPGDGGAGFGGMTFVPDPNHQWDGNSLP
jgi:hypothetical protein